MRTYSISFQLTCLGYRLEFNLCAGIHLFDTTNVAGGSRYLEGNWTLGYWPYPIMGDNAMQTMSGVKVNVRKANMGR
jgi:hypothetical protein